MATARPGTGTGAGTGGDASAGRVDWLGEAITPAAGEPGSAAPAPVGVPVDTSPTDHRKGRAVESKRGAY